MAINKDLMRDVKAMLTKRAFVPPPPGFGQPAPPMGAGVDPMMGGGMGPMPGAAAMPLGGMDPMAGGAAPDQQGAPVDPQAIVQQLLDAGVPPDQVLPSLQQTGAPPDFMQAAAQALQQVMSQSGQGPPPPVGAPPPQPTEQAAPSQGVDPSAPKPAKGGGKAEMGERMAVMEHQMTEIRQTLSQLVTLLQNFMGGAVGQQKTASDMSDDEKLIAAHVIRLLVDTDS